MASVRERLKEFIKSQGLRIRAFETSIGAANGYVNSIVNSIGHDFLNRILDQYPNLSRDWLLYGEGEMLKSSSQRSVGSVSGNGIATLGNNSPVLKGVTIDIAQEPASDIDDDKDVEGYKSEVKRLRALLSKAEREISRLGGRVEEQEKFIDKLLERK